MGKLGTLCRVCVPPLVRTSNTTGSCVRPRAPPALGLLPRPLTLNEQDQLPRRQSGLGRGRSKFGSGVKSSELNVALADDRPARWTGR